jgi:serine/threonine-protein kinase
VISERDVSQTQLHYRVLLLGPLALERNGVFVDASRWQNRVQTLFKLLVTAPARQRRREELIDLLWPETDLDTGAGNLRLLVHRLRLALGADLAPVLSHHGWIALNPAYEWEVDLDRFETLMEEAGADLQRIEAALALFRGEPLVEDRYEDWAAPIRARSERVWREGCLKLATLHKARGASDTAAYWYARLLATDPYEEEAMRGLMTALVRTGKRAEGLARFKDFEERLRKDLDVPPSPETIELVEEIRTHAPEARMGEIGPQEELPAGAFLGARPETQLIGRDSEMEFAMLAIDAVQSGSGRLLLISGEVGSGKTRLAQEVMLRLLESGALVASASCLERSQAVQFEPFLDLLAKLYTRAPLDLRRTAATRWPQLAWLLPDGDVTSEGAVDEPDEERALFLACAGLLEALSKESTVALLLDDVQWADEGSLLLLRYLARATRGRRVFLLAAYRDADVSPDHQLSKVMRDIGREGLAERLRLGRLGPNETTQLVTSVVGDSVPSELTEFVFRRSKGNPFFARRMVQSLGGRYRLLRQIGVGATSRVFEAQDSVSGGPVAVKLMLARTEADAKAILRFRQEGVTLSTLQHPHIVRVIDTVVEEHTSCIVMELLQGQTLEEALRADSLPLPRIKHLAEQVADALSAAHERGVVHRDIKPNNVMVLAGDEVKVTDFGIARLMRAPGQATSMTSTGMTLGTPLYMAPEQIGAGRVDARTDLYSLGAMLYHLATGQPPFSGDDALSVAYKQANEAPLPPSLLRADLPEDWDELILRSLSKAPEDRFQSAIAMKRAIAALPHEPRDASANRGWPLVPLERPIVNVIPAYRVPAANSALRASTIVPATLAVALLALVGFLALSRGLGSGSGTPPVAALGELNGPSGLATNSKGDVFVADEGNDRIQEFGPRGRAVRQWGSLGKGTLQFDVPTDLAIDPQGTIYVSDTGNKRIQKLRGRTNTDTFDYDAGALAVGSRGALYGTDYFRKQIFRLSPEDGRLLSVTSIPSVLVGRFPFAAGIAVDTVGRIYIADRLNNRVDVLSSTGKMLRAFGSAGDKSFNRPSDVTLDGRGNIYVADTYNDRVVELSPSGAALQSWGGTGQGLGHFHRPVSIAVDNRGHLFAADFFNNRVQKFSPGGNVLWATNGASPITSPGP